MDACDLRDSIAATLLAGFQWRRADGTLDHERALTEAEKLLNASSARDERRGLRGAWPWQG